MSETLCRRESASVKSKARPKRREKIVKANLIERNARFQGFIKREAFVKPIVISA